MEVKPGYKQTEVGVIPEDWDAGGLGRFWSVTDCKHVTAEFIPNGFPIASIKEVQSRFVDLTSAKQTTQRFYELLIEGGRKPQPGDLILSRNATVGEVAQVRESHPLFAMGQDVCLLRKKSPDFSTEFLQAVFQSPVVLNQLSNLMVGSTFKRANVEQIRNFSVPMPSPPEQRAIAEALSDVDGLLGGLDRLIAKKRDLKQATMQQLLTGQTRLPGFNGEWAMKRLGDVIEKLVGGGTPSRSNSEFWGNEIPWVTVKDFATFNPHQTQESITRIGLNNSASNLIPAGTLITATRMALGKAVVYEVDVAINQDLKALFLKPGNSVRFLYYWFEQHAEMIDMLGSGSTVKGISIAELRAISFPLVSLPEQTAIAAVLSDMDAELAALEQRREKTRAIKQAMMQELLTGKTRLVAAGGSHA
jgi:type I restriction enzyme S subunit